MTNIIEGIVDEMCPVKKFGIHQVKQPWISPPVIELIKDKDAILKRANLFKKIDSYGKRLRDPLTDVQIGFDRTRLTIKNNLNNKLNDPKQFSNIIQDVLSKTISTFFIDYESNVNVVTKKVADYINIFFFFFFLQI